MRVLFQPTEQTPQDWQSVDSSAWSSLNDFTCHALCVQGVTFDGADHYSVEHVGDGSVRVVVWYDDPGDWPRGQRWARVMTLHPLAVDADPRMGGAINTNQAQTIYAEPGIKKILDAAYAGNPKVTVMSWGRFDDRRSNPMRGQWVSDPQHEAQQLKQSVHGWREWAEHLDASELDARGHLLDQRAQGRYEVPKGTRTYYHNATNLATGAHSADHENELGLTAAGASSEQSGNVGTGGALVWAATTPSNEPNSSAWPTTGVYRYQLDVTAAGVDLNFGLLTLNGNTGHFARMNSGLTADQESFAQDESAFSGSGLHLATKTNPAWTSGNASDRFEALVAAQKVVGHGNQKMTLQLGETDDFADGPWAAAAATRRFLIT